MSAENKLSSDDLKQVLEYLPDVSLKPNGFPHPNIDPVIFEYGAFALRWYSLAYLFGVLFGYFLIIYLNRKFNKNPIKEKGLENIPVWVILSIIIGGRIGYVLFYNFDYYMNNLSQIVQVWRGGMSFHGGVLGIILGIYFYCLYYKEKYLKVTDLIAVVAPIGIFFGRMANFINQELRGKICNLDWCVIYPDETIARYPSQVIEALTEGLILFIILIIAATRFKGLNKTGLVSGLFLSIYSIFRFGVEFMKEPDSHGYFFEQFTTGQVLSIPSFIVGLVILFMSLKTKPKTN